MDIPEIGNEQLASEYDDLAVKALANPDLSEGLANEIARVSKTTAATLRAKGWQRPGPGRTSNTEKGLPSQDRIISFRGTEEERQKLMQQAEAAGQTLSQFVRERCGLD